MTVFLAESRERSSKDGMTYGGLFAYESRKDQKNCALNNRGGVVLLYEVLWFMSVSPWIVDGHIR